MQAMPLSEEGMFLASWTGSCSWNQVAVVTTSVVWRSLARLSSSPSVHWYAYTHLFSLAFQILLDNAVMIAWASMHRFLAGDHDSYEVAPRPKWSLEDLNEKGEEWDNDPKLKYLYASQDHPRTMA